MKFWSFSEILSETRQGMLQEINKQINEQLVIIAEMVGLGVRVGYERYCN